MVNASLAEPLRVSANLIQIVKL